MFDADDTPGYLTDAFKTAIEKGLLSLTLTRIGTETRMWQASTRFPRSTGYHVEIAPDALQAVMAALGAWTRIGTPPAPPPAAAEPGGFFDDEPEPLKHDLYADADKIVPTPICDANGSVVLGMCKVCGRAEIELDYDNGVCPGRIVCDEPVEASGLFD